jgi:ubiquinone/menaquinone biosynthesis C-methylase UbiE
MIRSAKSSVFDIYAHEYDWLTNATQREPNHQKEIAALIERFRPTHVLDAGCATGLTSMLFAKAGVPAVGLDRSKAMLTVARKKFKGSGLPLSFRYGRFEQLPKNLTARFDLVVCLANSISGVDSKGALKKSLEGFHRVLKPGGALVLQLLNYKALKDGDIQPIRATGHEDIVYLRYMERTGRRVSLHVVRVDTTQSPPAFEPFRSEFDGFTPSDITSTLQAVGFRKILRYSDLLLSRKYIRASHDLVVIVERR